MSFYTTQAVGENGGGSNSQSPQQQHFNGMNMFSDEARRVFKSISANASRPEHQVHLGGGFMGDPNYYKTGGGASMQRPGGMSTAAVGENGGGGVYKGGGFRGDPNYYNNGGNSAFQQQFLDSALAGYYNRGGGNGGGVSTDAVGENGGGNSQGQDQRFSEWSGTNGRGTSPTTLAVPENGGGGSGTYRPQPQHDNFEGYRQMSGLLKKQQDMKMLELQKSGASPQEIRAAQVKFEQSMHERDMNMHKHISDGVAGVGNNPYPGNNVGFGPVPGGGPTKDINNRYADIMKQYQTAQSQMNNSAISQQAAQNSLHNPAATTTKADFDMSTREGRMASAKAAQMQKQEIKAKNDAAKSASRVNPYSNGMTSEEYRMDKHGLHADPSLSPERAKKVLERERQRAAETGIRNASVQYEDQKKADAQAATEKHASQYSPSVQAMMQKRRDAKEKAKNARNR